MWNCAVVVRDGRKVAYFASIDAAEMYVSLMKQVFSHLDIQWNIDWAYVEGLTF